MQNTTKASVVELTALTNKSKADVRLLMCSNLTKKKKEETLKSHIVNVSHSMGRHE